MNTSKTCSLILCLALAVSLDPCAFANGAKGKGEEYTAVARLDDGSITFSVKLERVLFALTSVQNKYKVIRIRVVNDSASPLALSAKDDRIEIAFPGGKAAGILDLFERDPAFWDALPPEFRKLLAYPASIPAHEEDSIFVFVPTDSLTDLPAVLRCKIASLPKELSIAPRSVSKK